MTQPRSVRLVGATVALTVVAVTTACDSDKAQPSPTAKPTIASPTTAPTAVVKSAVTVTIRPPRTAVTASQRQILSIFTDYLNARTRFESHPWIIDPDYVRILLPGAPGDPTETGTVGLTGPMAVQVLAVELPNPSTANVSYCVDDRGLRYLGRDGAVDVPGPAGDRHRGDVVLESTEFQLTLDAAVDGKPAKEPRWLVSKSAIRADPSQCQGLASTAPPSPPTPSTPTSG